MICKQRGQNDRRSISVSFQSGQASLEMILMLVVGMLIALGLVYRFNTAFKKYTIEMYGTYYRCLLETGELPGVASVCKDRKARFDIAGGRELVRNVPGSAGTSGGGGNGSGSGGSGGKSGSSNSQAGSSNDKNNSGGGDAGGSGSSPEAVGNGGSSGGGTGSTIGRLRNLGRVRSTAVGNVKDGSGDGSKDETAGSISVSSSRVSADPLRRERTKTDFKMDGGDYQRAETAAVTQVTASSKSKSAVDRGGDSLRPRKTVEKTDRKPAATLDQDKGGGLEFGRLFRLFLIFGIIVAIVVFLGGQLLQISKSGEQ